MREVISRRFSRLPADPGSDEWNESFAATPNLVVIDGGKGQLSAALEAMQELDLPRVAVIALAKRIEEVFVPGRSEPILLPSHSPGLQLLQRIRDEAHRFAITFHRQRRDAAARESMFDQLEGVGPARRRALLQHFGSAERVAKRPREELEGVPGVPAEDRAQDLRAAAPDRRRLGLRFRARARRLVPPALPRRCLSPPAGCGSGKTTAPTTTARAAARSDVRDRRRQDALPGGGLGGRRQGRQGSRVAPRRRRVAARSEREGEGAILGPNGHVAPIRRSRPSSPRARRWSSRASGSTAPSCS